MNTADKSILIAGCGGGYDLFGGLPLYFRNTAKKITMVNFSFTDQQSFDVLVENKLCEKITKYTYLVNGYKDCDGVSKRYCPEARLASELNHPVYAILIHENPTISDVRDSYNKIMDREGTPDCMYLVDGGCDVLLSGREEELGTPVEDMMHLKVANSLAIKEKYIMAVGVDLDMAHRVTLYDLETRLKDLEPLKVSEERWNLSDPSVAKYKEIFYKCQPINSIVHSLVVATLDGHSGTYLPPHLKGRIDENKIELNPRICTAFTYDMDKLAQSIVYLGDLMDDMDSDKVDEVINEIHWRNLNKW